MSDNEIYNLLFNGGHYTLPYLIKFSHSTAGNIYLINNNESVVYDNHTYNVSSFDYTPPDNNGDSGTLTISSVDNSLFEFVENSDQNIRIDVIGVLLSDGTVQKIKSYKHFFGSVSYNENMELEFNLGKDDRLDMTFLPYTYDTDNNRGNA